MSRLIYVLKDPASPLDVRYVGCTAGSAAMRLKQHIEDAASGKTNDRCNWIRSVIADGRFPVVETLDTVEGDWEIAERFWIDYFKTNGAKLVNGTVGGRGVIGLSTEKRSDAARRGHQGLSVERRSEIATKRSLSRTHESRSEAARRARSGMTPEARSEATRRGYITRTPEQIRAFALSGIASLSPEQKSAKANKGWETRRRNVPRAA